MRTRRIGKRVLAAAHDQGVRHLAMEALWDRSLVDVANETRELPGAEQGYLAQPEMREFIQSALDLGWTLLAYEADMRAEKERFGDLMNLEVTNWREEVQAQNLVDLLGSLHGTGSLFVWCGNGHLIKRPRDEWVPMGYHFQRLSGIEAFAIDQTPTVKFPGSSPDAWLSPDVIEELKSRGGTAGFLQEAGFGGVDAYILSLDNELE